MTRKALILIRHWWGGFAAESRAATATEYAIMLALIIVVSVGVIRSIGEKFYNLYTAIANAVGNTI